MQKLINIIRRTPNTRLIRFQSLFYQDGQAVLITHSSGRLLFDVATSHSHKITDAEGALLERFADTNDPIALKDSHRISSLIAAGQLFGPDGWRKKHRRSNRLRLQDVVVQIAYDCNLKCTYCYADEGKYGSDRRLVMSTKTAERVVDFAFENRGTSTLGFSILGGEPLMNKSALCRLIEYGSDRGNRDGVGVEFSVTTNGIGLDDEILGFFHEYNVAVRLSMDGTKDINDHYRLNAKGYGTYDVVNNKFGTALKASPVKFQVRASYFGEHGDRLLDQAQTMLTELGYDSIKMDFIWGVDGTVGEVTLDNLDLTLNGIDHLSSWFADQVLNRGFDWRKFNPYSKYMGRLVQKPIASNLYDEETRGQLVAGGSILENSGIECGAGINVISISSTGEIYTCHRTEGNPMFRMGDIWIGVDHSFIQYWSDNWRLSHPDADCSKCWARFICLGGCPAFGVYKHNNPMKNDRIRCQLRKQFIASSIVLMDQLTDQSSTNHD